MSTYLYTLRAHRRLNGGNSTGDVDEGTQLVMAKWRGRKKKSSQTKMCIPRRRVNCVKFFFKKKN